MRDDQALAFEKIGKCYIKLKKYAQALVAFKLQLRVGWMYKKKDIELMAYDNMGMAYYYLSDLDGAEYYHQRMADKTIEPKDSFNRLACIENEERKLRRIQLEKDGVVGHAGTSNSTFLPLVAKDPEERAQLLYREYKVSTGTDETPRIVLTDPLAACDPIELPSPRKSYCQTHFIQTVARHSPEKTDSFSSAMNVNRKNRALLNKMQHSTIEKVAFDYAYVVGSKTGVCYGD
jgi:tetratricopeptide (TPR) repeat protein